MGIQEVSQERNNTLLQLAQAHTKAGEVRAEIERLNALGAQLAAEIRNMEASIRGLNLALQVLEQANGEAKQSPAG